MHIYSQGLITKNELVKVLQIEHDSALIRGCAYSLGNRGANCTQGLYSTLKTSIERRHQASGALKHGCDSCRARIAAKERPSLSGQRPKASYPVQTWIPLVYLQSLSWKTRLLEQAQAVRKAALKAWDEYAKATAQSVMNLLYATFRRWSREQVTYTVYSFNLSKCVYILFFLKGCTGLCDNKCGYAGESQGVLPHTRGKPHQ